MKTSSIHKPNNKGFTLVELLTAIVILAIVVVPLLNAFAVSARTNAKAKESMNATSIAQNIMENLKVTSIEELAYQFNYPDKGFGLLDLSADYANNENPREMYLQTELDGSTTLADIDPNGANAAFASVSSTDGGNTYEFVGQSDGIYRYAIDNVPMGKSKYDVLINVDASAYRAGTVNQATVTPNNEEIVNISDFDVYKDAFYIESSEDNEAAAVEYFEAAYNEYLIAHPGATSETIDFGKFISRTISVKIEKNGIILGSEIPRTKVTVSYIYKFNKTGYFDTIAKQYMPEPSIIYDNTDSKQKLNRIFLFYKPLYSSSSTLGISDDIVIDNSNNFQVDVYVAKQEGAGLSADDLKKAESEYRMKLQVKETINTTEPAANIHTNLGESLYKVYADDSSFDAEIPGQAEYIYNNSFFSYSNLSVPKGSEVLGITSLVKEEKTDLLYDVVIEVYKENASANKYLPSMKIKEIAGSQLD